MVMQWYYLSFKVNFYKFKAVKKYCKNEKYIIYIEDDKLVLCVWFFLYIIYTYKHVSILRWRCEKKIMFVLFVAVDVFLFFCLFFAFFDFCLFLPIFCLKQIVSHGVVRPQTWFFVFKNINHKTWPASKLKWSFLFTLICL